MCAKYSRRCADSTSGSPKSMPGAATYSYLIKLNTSWG
jgi:hypothetical protein